MTDKEKIILDGIRELATFTVFACALFYAKDLMETVKYGFLFLVITLMNKRI